MTIQKGSNLISNKIGRTISIGLLAILAMGSLAACGTSPDTGSTNTEPTAVVSTPTPDASMPNVQLEPTETMGMPEMQVIPTETPAVPDSAAAPADSGAVGSSDAASGASGAAATTEVTAVLKEWAIELSQTEVAAGTVRFTVTNEGMMMHNFTVTDSSGQIAATPNFPASAGAQTLEVELKPGTYTLICSLPGHAARGRTIQLVVK